MKQWKQFTGACILGVLVCTTGFFIWRMLASTLTERGIHPILAWGIFPVAALVLAGVYTLIHWLLTDD